MSPESLPSWPGPDGMLQNLLDSGQVRQNCVQPERARMTKHIYSA